MDLRDMQGLGDGSALGSGREKGMWMTPISLVCRTGWMVVPFTGAENSKNNQIQELSETTELSINRTMIKKTVTVAKLQQPWLSSTEGQRAEQTQEEAFGL